MNAKKLLHRVDKNPKHSMLVLNSSSAIMFTGNKLSMIQHDNVTNDQLEIQVLNKSSNSIQRAMFYPKDCCEVAFLSGHKNRHAVDGTNPANQSRLVVLSQYLSTWFYACQVVSRISEPSTVRTQNRHIKMLPPLNSTKHHTGRKLAVREIPMRIWKMHKKRFYS